MKYFITFGGPTQNYIDAGNRLINQEKDLSLFDDIKLYTHDNLKKYDFFWNKHKDFIQKNKRGYGYWLWKPYIIKKKMESINDGDILLYLDCGCELGKEKKKNLIDFFKYIEKDNIIGSPTALEKDWCKMDLIEYLDLKDSEYLNTAQRQAGAILFLVCEKTRKLVNEWYEICCNYHLLDDTPSISKNLTGFWEHRHDQAIFSLLTKKYNIYSNKNLYDCIYILQNKTGISKII